MYWGHRRTTTTRGKNQKACGKKALPLEKGQKLVKATSPRHRSRAYSKDQDLIRIRESFPTTRGFPCGLDGKESFLFFFPNEGIFYLFFNINLFNWRLITILQWFCHTLTWIHHRCTCVPHPEPPPLPPSQSHPSGSSQCTSPEYPVSCIEPGLLHI